MLESPAAPVPSCCCSSPASSGCSSSAYPLTSALTFMQLRFKSIDTLKGKKTKLLADNFPNIARELDMAQNDPEVADLKTLMQDSGKRLMWKCSVCGFGWRTSVMARTVMRQNCPDCHQREHPKLGDVSPKLVSEWSRARNDIFVDPADVESTSKDRVWWQCGSCHVNFQARVRDRVTGHSNCPECDRGQYAQFRMNKQLLSEFHPSKNGDLTLVKLRPTDRVKVWWLCNTCGFEWQCPVGLRAGSAKTSRSFQCPECFETAEAQKKAGKGNKTGTPKRGGKKAGGAQGTAEGTPAATAGGAAATDEFVGTNWDEML